MEPLRIISWRLPNGHKAPRCEYHWSTPLRLQAVREAHDLLNGRGYSDEAVLEALTAVIGSDKPNRILKAKKLYVQVYGEGDARKDATRQGLSRTSTVATATPSWSAVGHQCVYCGAPAEHMEHVWPRARGGDDHPNNLVRACRACNYKKGSKSILTMGCPECWALRDPGDVDTATGTAYYHCRCGHSWAQRWDLQAGAVRAA